jgi:uncharacterized protein (DUF1015 family)
MAEVCPFRGIRYNEGIVGDLAPIICPPYDIITPEEQQLYYQKNDYNTIRLEYPSAASEEQPKANVSDEKYKRAAATLQQWLEQGILQVDRAPSFYLHHHHFDYLGEKRVRRGLTARFRLEPWGNGIYPHEETYSKAKDDRSQLMRACRASFSPLLSLYQDPEQKVASILAEASQAEPIIERHVVWAITNAELQQQIKRSLAAQPLYIADGHHRYETALDYQRERASTVPTFSGKEAFNYVMMTLVDFSDPGLVVLPIHRLVRGISPSVLAGLKNRLEQFFILESVPLLRDLIGSSMSSYFGVLGLEPGSLVFLKQRQDVSLEAMMPGDRSRAYRELNISLLNHVILDKVLSGAKGLDIAYTVNTTEAYQWVKEGKYQLAFLLNPPQPETVKAVADAKDRMPRKSTYFYPKLPAGLIINSLD